MKCKIIKFLYNLNVSESFKSSDVLNVLNVSEVSELLMRVLKLLKLLRSLVNVLESCKNRAFA